MRYSAEPRFRKYIKGYVFLLFARKFGDKYSKKLMDTATKTGTDAATTASKRVVRKAAEATADLIVNKIANKITSIGKPKEKEKTKGIEEIYIPPEKRQQIIDDLKLIEHHCIKMEFQKIANFFDKTPDDKKLPRFVTKKWIEVYDQSGGNYNVNKEIRIKTSMLRSDLCNYSNTYVVVKGIIAIVRPNGNGRKRNKGLHLKQCTIHQLISKINGVKIDNAEDLDVVMPMYKLLEYSKNYRKTTDSSWNYYRDEPSNPLSSNSESFKCKTSITGNTYNVGDGEKGYGGNEVGKNKTKVVIPLKHLTNF